MNRRSFLSTILKAAAAPMVLPPALTYARSWKPVSGIIVPPTVVFGYSFLDPNDWTVSASMYDIKTGKQWDMTQEDREAFFKCIFGYNPRAHEEKP